MPFDETHELGRLELSTFFGEESYSAKERTTTRPTLEVNGLWGGYIGEGAMTVIPSQAHAKISCRLVQHQDPHVITQLLKDHIAKHLPSYVTCVSLCYVGAASCQSTTCRCSKAKLRN
jgi:acetylornithine deacetylase/succinyl-diaminopimelate desuccinylase-like protein